MGVAKAYEHVKDCKAIKLVLPQRESPCDIDGSAVSYTKFKATEGRLLLKQLKKMAKGEVSIGIPGPVLPLAPIDVYHELNSARDVVWPLLANVLNNMY
ncbi:hypothetical protein BGZ76_006768, partial [Entomortierella beljakovae]